MNGQTFEQVVQKLKRGVWLGRIDTVWGADYKGYHILGACYEHMEVVRVNFDGKVKYYRSAAGAKSAITRYIRNF